MKYLRRTFFPKIIRFLPSCIFPLSRFLVQAHLEVNKQNFHVQAPKLNNFDPYDSSNDDSDSDNESKSKEESDFKMSEAYQERMVKLEDQLAEMRLQIKEILNVTTKRDQISRNENGLPPIVPPLPLTPNKNGSSPNKIAMTDILKDINNVKLRHVQKSPSGRRMQLNRREVNPDLQTILKKRYAAMHMSPQFPRSSSDNDSFSFSDNS